MAVSCTKVHIDDIEFCGDMGPDGATCFHTLTDQPRDLTKEAWDSERFGQFCTKSEGFASLKKALEQLCHVSKDCDYKSKAQMTAFFERVQKAQIRQTNKLVKPIYRGEFRLVPNLGTGKLNKNLVDSVPVSRVYN